MRKSLNTFVVLFAVFFLSGFTDDLSVTPDRAPEDFISSYDPDNKYYPGKRWKKAIKPELLGWSSEKLKKAREFAKLLSSAAAMVIDNGIIVAEWGGPAGRYKTHSIRKSFLSALFGIAVAQGQIDISATLAELGIDDKPPKLTAAEKQAKASDLLKARSGVYHGAAYETSSIRKKRPKRGSHPPGTFWYYNNWDFNALLTIYEQRTGSSVFMAFKSQLSDPLQMQDFRLKDTKYQRSKVSIHPAYRFRMSARDLARFGLLYLRKGRWKDKQIIPESWVRQSAASYSTTDQKGRFSGYGYLWWLGEGAMTAAGTGGQRLFVLPDQNVVFVHRVNTGVKGNRVKGSRITHLLNLILKAKGRPRASPGKGGG